MVAAALVLAAGAAVAQGPPPAPKPTTLASRPGATGGEALYVEHCASCHAPNGMGTGLLARRIQPPLLEARDNLPAAYVIAAARNGIGNMPAIPRGEVSDAELRQIADYLAAGPHEAAP
jgi:mono/diheme cytochrome c family protein